MKEDPASNQYAIIISKKVTGQIDLPGSCPYPVFTEEDIQGKALGLLQRNKEKRLWVLIFLPPEDTHIIDNFFRNFNYREIAYGMVIISTDKKETELPEISKSINAVRTTRLVEREFSFLVEKSFSMIREEALLKGQQEARYMTLLDTQRDLEELIYIGKALSLEKDPEKLLRSILYQSKKITGADAGSIFLAEEGPEKEKRLRFKCSHTFSKDLPYEEFTM
ncbi:MAG TPA: hypothetical protein VMX75_03970, partial [Spirochaetia bacterium]|nr:hypothetical protein [Spirochaetia bacterium]